MKKLSSNRNALGASIETIESSIYREAVISAMVESISEIHSGIQLIDGHSFTYADTKFFFRYSFSDGYCCYKIVQDSLAKSETRVTILESTCFPLGLAVIEGPKKVLTAKCLNKIKEKLAQEVVPHHDRFAKFASKAICTKSLTFLDDVLEECLGCSTGVYLLLITESYSTYALNSKTLTEITGQASKFSGSSLLSKNLEPALTIIESRKTNTVKNSLPREMVISFSYKQSNAITPENEVNHSILFDKEEMTTIPLHGIGRDSSVWGNKELRAAIVCGSSKQQLVMNSLQTIKEKICPIILAKEQELHSELLNVTSDIVFDDPEE